MVKEIAFFGNAHGCPFTAQLVVVDTQRMLRVVGVIAAFLGFPLERSAKRRVCPFLCIPPNSFVPVFLLRDI